MRYMEVGSLGIMVVFAITIFIGKALRLRVPEILFRIIVLILVFTISMWATLNGLGVILQSTATSLFILSLIILSLLAIGYLVDRRGADNAIAEPKGRVDIPLIVAVIAGWLIGLSGAKLPQDIVEEVVALEVYLVIAVTGLTVANSINLETLKRGGRSALTAAMLSLTSALISGLLAAYILNVPPRITLGIAFGLGWYSFAGPFIAQAYGPLWGFTAFLVNVLREQATFILVPLLRKPFLSMVSLGGATTMDNTLPVYGYVYGEEASVVSIIHGFVLTLLIPFLQGFIVGPLA